MVKEKLNIGIILESEIIPAWMYLALTDIIQSENIEIKILIKYFDGEKNGKINFFYNMFKKFENKRKLLIENAFEEKNLKKDIKNIKIINHFENSIESIDNQITELDVLINFTNKKIDVKYYKNIKFGIWHYRFGKNHFENNSLNSFWEVFNNENITKVDLEAWFKEKSYLINSVIISTDLLSVKRNSNYIYWKNSSLLLKNLIKLQQNKNWFFEELKKQPLNLINEKLPKTKDYLKIIIKMLFRNVKARINQKLFQYKWIILFKFGENSIDKISNFNIISPKNGFLADPHIIFKDDQYFVFVEETKTMDGKGHISVINIDSKGNHTKPKKIIECKYHLSYPFIFEYQNEYYLIPESHENKTIEIYKCNKFPDIWEFKQTLFENVDAVDTTLFQYKNKWWMFTCVKKNSNFREYDDLFLYYSDNPFSKKWVSHPMNPIVSDIRKARSAGNIFEKEGKIFRPSQDCSFGYGYRVIINQILKLDENEYQEKEIRVIDPSNSKMDGIHTYNFNKNIQVIDGKIKSFKTK